MDLRACKLCACYLKTPKMAVGECRRNPPQLVAVIAQDAMGRPSQQIVGAFPGVQPDQWCAAFDMLMPVSAAKAS